MTPHALVLHLQNKLWELSVQPLDVVHEGTGIRVWLLISLTQDAYERALLGRLG